MELQHLENELKKRLKYPYIWGRKQNNYWDYLTKFIYNIDDFDQVKKIINSRYQHNKHKGIKYKDLFNYAINRWFNFWSAEAVEKIFCSFPNVIPAKNKRDKLKDFTINNIKFDHKTTVFPRTYTKNYNNAKRNPEHLIKWLYYNQSQQQRKHLRTRLFIVLYDKRGEHWKLKSEILWLKQIIVNYVNNFDESRLFKFRFVDKIDTFSDIIWAEY